MLGTAMLAGNVTRTSAAAVPDSSHLVWVWQFNEDGDAARIRDSLATHGLGILLKTHDGTRWMSRWDNSPMAIEGATSVREASLFFEKAGVPFHAWCVVQGYDPVEEARMCAEVLANGARSMTIDLEPPDHGNYWQASKAEAVAFGRELRRLSPGALVTTAPDPRPWQLEEVPMQDFAGFSNSIAPQTYWDTFSSRTNFEMLKERGFDPGEDGITPELILDVSHQGLAPYRLPIRPVGQGNSGLEAWQRFVGHSQKLGMPNVSVWRYGTMASTVLPLLDQKSKATEAPGASGPTMTTVPAIAPPGISAERARQVSRAGKTAMSKAGGTSISTDWHDMLGLESTHTQPGDADADGVTSLEGHDRAQPGDKEPFTQAGVIRDVKTTPRWKWVLPNRPFQ